MVQHRVFYIKNKLIVGEGKMAVIYHDKNQVFHLQNQKISYIFAVLKNGQLGHIYFGERITDRENLDDLIEYAKRDMAPYTYEGDSRFSLEHLKQEYPTYGSGDMRYGAFTIESKKGSKVVDFKYKEHIIYKGKKKLEGLPALYMEGPDEGETLEVILEDETLKAKIVLSYTIYDEFPVIARNTRIINQGNESIVIHNCMSMSLDLPDKEYEMLTLSGSWSRERHVCKRNLQYGLQGVYSLRGCSSHQHNPFIALMRKGADEFKGEVIGFSLVYSGDFIAQAEVDVFDVTRVLMGIHPQEFRWSLGENQSFQTPEAVMVYSAEGLGYMSRVYHQLYRTRLARGVWRDKERPILINNWEATYFDFNEEKILDLAQKAKQIGVELLVLDDGWFGKRNSADCSLGDWHPNLEKLPSGIDGISRTIEEMGMKFGLWFEPEMTNKDSDLFREHPDWLLADLDRNYCHSRNQYVLDFSKEEVVDYIYNQMEKILKESAISYIKWDMNRSFSEVFSNNNVADYQGMVRHKYILGVYSLYERLIQNFPNILFESCASGGARFDPGMLYYAPQAWTSDNTDAISRLKIQHGTSMVYPISSIGSHVSAAPNHQVFRKTPLETRANVAFFGTFGYELDITALSKEELEQMACYIKFMKEHRELIQKGDFYRLMSPFEGNETAWLVVNREKTAAILGYYRVLEPENAKFSRVHLVGLNKENKYQIQEMFGAKSNMGEKYGDELMNIGLSVSDYSSGLPEMSADQQGDYFSRLFYLKKII